MARNTSCMAGAWPSISGVAVWRSSVTSSRWLSSTARRISSTALGKSNGLGRYSNAPRWKAETALSRSEYAVMMMTGKPGCISRTFSSSCSPEPPGIRMSLTSTWGPCRARSPAVTSARASSTSRGWVKLRVGRFSRASAFSRTKRIDGSSSTNQIGFMCVYLPCGFVSQTSGERNQDSEIGATRNTVALDQPVVPLHKCLCQRQTQS